MKKETQQAEIYLQRLFYPDQLSIKRVLVFILNLDLILVTVSKFAAIFLGNEAFQKCYQFINYGSIVFVLLYFAKRIIMRKKLDSLWIMRVIVLFPTIVSMIVSIIFLPDFSVSIKNATIQIVLFFAVCIPACVLSSEIIYWGDLVTISKPFIMMSMVFSFMVVLLPDNNAIEYNLVSSALLIPTITAMVYYFTEKKKWAGVIFLLNTAIIFLKGSRAPLLCVAGATIAVFLYSCRKMTYKKIILYFLFMTGVAIVVLLWQDIILRLYELNPNSRTLYLLMNISDKELFETGRTEVYSSAINLITQRPITGYGVLGASYHLSRQLGFDVLQKGAYAHNIVLDLILHYGLIFGAVIFIIWIANVVSILLGKSRIKEFVYILSIMSGYCVFLMVSGTYIEDKIFWITIGFIISQAGSSLTIRQREDELLQEA